MIKTFLKVSLIILSLSAFFSCTQGNKPTTAVAVDTLSTAQSVKQADPDFLGEYKESSETKCGLAISITKNGSDFAFLIKEGKNEYTGKVIIEKQGEDVYLNFDGKIGNNKPGSISGLYKDNTITIQNEGNAENQYNYFKNCDNKYIEFKK
jgi:hypothetical protein